MVLRKNNVEPKWMLVFAFFAAGGFFGGLAIYLFVGGQALSTTKLHLPKGTYQYINPTLATDPVGNPGNFSTVGRELDLKVNRLVDDAQKKGITSAVYFRDLEPGTWLAINSNMQFSPGVLLKVPIMIAYYRLAEQDPAVLKGAIRFSGSYLPQDAALGPVSPLAAGADYTVEELIGKMVRDSDETAAALLFNHINKNALGEVFSDLGVDFNEDTTTRDYISLKRYSLFFRVLYNANYLSPGHSEQALGLLAQDPARSLLQANLPQSIPFIHRLGGRSLVQNGAPLVEAYECDIIYYPNHNYLLCAAAQAPKLSLIQNLFSKIGQAIYEDASYRYGQ